MAFDTNLSILHKNMASLTLWKQWQENGQISTSIDRESSSLCQTMELPRKWL